MGLDLSPEEIVEELLDGVVAQVEQAVPWRPGAVELLAVAARGRRALRPGHDVLPAVRGADPGPPAARVVPVVVTGEQVERGKPHPEPYLTAAAALGVPPEECVAIEDSNTGAKSAEAAGCLVLVVENHVPVLEGPRRVFRDTLAGLTAADLAGLSAPSDD